MIYKKKLLLCNNIKCFKIYKIEKLKVFNVIVKQIEKNRGKKIDCVKDFY